MKTLLFFLFIATAVVVFAVYLKRTSPSARTQLSKNEKKAREARKRRIENMATAANSRLADKEEVWRARRRHMALASESADKTVGTRHFKYKADEEPGYDGYSRSGRHRVTPGRIRSQKPLDEVVPPADGDSSSRKPAQSPEQR
jgi:cell division protein FtsL